LKSTNGQFYRALEIEGVAPNGRPLSIVDDGPAGGGGRNTARCPLLGDRFSASSQVKGDVDEHVFLGADHAARVSLLGQCASVDVVAHGGRLDAWST
jgi:hypothetical protein